MTYLDLRNDVADWLARDDVPLSVYRLATAELNARLRLIEMEATTSLAVSTEATNLPSDFLEVRGVYLDRDERMPLDATSEFAKNTAYETTGDPRTYIITGGATPQILVNPSPDGAYTLFLRYVARLAALSADTDTNDVLTNYPALYLYASLKQAAAWSQDRELVGSYAAMLEDELTRVERSNERRRFGSGPLRRRVAVAP